MSFTVFSSSSLPTEIFTSSLVIANSVTSRSRNGSQASTRSAWSSRIGRTYSPVLCALRRCDLLKVGAERDGFGKQLIPLAWMPRDDTQRQLHHFRRLQLRRRYVMQHVRRVLATVPG